MNLLELPDITIEGAARWDSAPLVMVLGGRAPSPEFLASLARGCEVWAVDRGVEACRAAGVVPAALIGDRDSGSAQSWRWAAERGAKTREYQSDKDLTDFQLALEILADECKNNEKRIILTGALGGRFDHLWSLTLSFLNRTRAGVPFCMADDREGVMFVRGGEAYSLSFARRPKALSLLSFSPLCRGVNLSGVHWPLTGAELRYDFPYAVSNRVEGEGRVEISCVSGTLGLYWTWNDAF